MTVLRLTGLLTFALTACTTADPGPSAISAPASLASAELREPGGRTVARATAEQAGDSLRIRVEAAGLARGAYGVHLHAVGQCDAPGFAAAGPHWNPAGRRHGKDNPEGMHMGDLPNLLVGADGRGSFEYTIAAAKLTGAGPNVVLDGDGAAMVVHAQPDDYRTDPSGNSGARIACGVLAG